MRKEGAETDDGRGKTDERKGEDEEEEEQILLSQIKLHNYYYSNHNI